MRGVCPISLDSWPYELDEVSALGLNLATDLYGSVAKTFSCPKMLRWGVGKEPTASMQMSVSRVFAIEPLGERPSPHCEVC